MHPLWHFMFFVMLPISLYATLWSYDRVRAYKRTYKVSHREAGHVMTVTFKGNPDQHGEWLSRWHPDDGFRVRVVD